MYMQVIAALKQAESTAAPPVNSIILWGQSLGFSLVSYDICFVFYQNCGTGCSQCPVQPRNTPYLWGSLFVKSADDLRLSLAQLVHLLFVYTEYLGSNEEQH